MKNWLILCFSGLINCWIVGPIPYRYCTSSLSNWYHIHPYRSSILLFQGSPWNIYTRYIIHPPSHTAKITTLSPLTHSSQLYSTYIYHHSAHLFFNTILLFVLWSHLFYSSICPSLLHHIILNHWFSCTYSLAFHVMVQVEVAHVIYQLGIPFI